MPYGASMPYGPLTSVASVEVDQEALAYPRVALPPGEVDLGLEEQDADR